MSQGLLARSRGFRLFWGGRTISLAGTQIARVALTVLVYRLGGGAAGISILLLAFTTTGPGYAHHLASGGPNTSLK